MRPLSTIVVGLLAFPGSAQEPAPDPAQILRQAAEACGEVRTAEYRADLESRATPEAEPLVRAGRVRFARWEGGAPPAPEPDPGGREVAFASKLGASVRMDLDGGTVYAYDATKLDIVLPEKKQVLRVHVADGGELFITGNVVRGLVQTPLLDATPLSAAAERESALTYAGIEAVGGVPCHVVEVAQPDTDTYREASERWFLGVEDHLPRRHTNRGLYNDILTTRSLEITDLKTNLEVPPATFQVEQPEGFALEVFEPGEPPELLPVGAEAPPWTLRDAAGEEHELSDYRGRIVVLDFWGTWCAPCVRALPELQALHEGLHDRGLAVIGISCREPAHADPAGLMERRGYTYQLLLQGDPVAESYHVTSYPTVYVIGADGRILHRDSGYYEGLGADLAHRIEMELDRRGR